MAERQPQRIGASTSPQKVTKETKKDARKSPARVRSSNEDGIACDGTRIGLRLGTFVLFVRFCELESCGLDLIGLPLKLAVSCRHRAAWLTVGAVTGEFLLLGILLQAELSDFFAQFSEFFYGILSVHKCVVCCGVEMLAPFAPAGSGRSEHDEISILMQTVYGRGTGESS